MTFHFDFALAILFAKLTADHSHLSVPCRRHSASQYLHVCPLKKQLTNGPHCLSSLFCRCIAVGRLAGGSSPRPPFPYHRLHFASPCLPSRPPRRRPRPQYRCACYSARRERAGCEEAPPVDAAAFSSRTCSAKLPRTSLHPRSVAARRGFPATRSGASAPAPTSERMLIARRRCRKSLMMHSSTPFAPKRAPELQRRRGASRITRFCRHHHRGHTPMLTATP
jgi:hypothetical protein